MKKVLIETYGCTMNQADTDIISSTLKNNEIEVTEGFYESGEYDYVVVNTCTVKRQTEQRIVDRLEKIGRLGNKLIVTGCLASANPDIVNRAVPKAIIVNTSRIREIANIVTSDRNKQIDYNTYFAGNKLEGFEHNGKAIAKIPVSEGCLSGCSFCETKFARGALNSYPMETIIKAVEKSVKNGAKEIDLTSQDTGAYGADKKTNIAELLSQASEIEGDFRIRIGMLNPEHLHKYFDELIDAFRMGKAYRFVHLPVQSGSNKVLKHMKRKYTVDEFQTFINEFREKLGDVTIETDVIVGYPTEDVADFEQTMAMLTNVRPNITNISKFSKRHHSIATKLKQLKDSVIKDRSVIMARAVKEMQYIDMSKLIGKKLDITITEKNNATVSGRDDAYRLVALENGNFKEGDKVSVEIVNNSYACYIGRAYCADKAELLKS
ncbi:MAG: tRNA (N(6)-L-threonylcarbamoyladenosine(37)-C(2))-methylthiotransferase [Candidatus Marsarchaeota archaeon]|jgi:MiaB-like tRNA modifying enzyme|nr:tRNA (N(6)-L-threonylcarbamoyladenosine(37)-C(2))-methylthiotransferase [Candidatus Marsarchaeota archaeon]